MRKRVKGGVEKFFEGAIWGNDQATWSYLLWFPAAAAVVPL